MLSVKITGLDELEKNFSRHREIVETAVQKALKKSIAMAETEAKKRTPVDTGLLQGSIGGEQGYSYVRGLTAGVGTNVKYALFVEMSDKSRHKVGEAHYMEHGVQAALPYMQDAFTDAMKEISEELAKQKL